MQFGSKFLEEYKTVYVAAEIGVNHNGELNLAKETVHAAFEAGADAVKMQLFNPDTLVTRDAKQAGYQAINFPEGSHQYKMLTDLNLSLDQHMEIREYCSSLGIDYATTPYDKSDFQKFVSLEPDWLKIASMHFVETDFVLEAFALGYPTVLSTGMCAQEDVSFLRSKLSEKELKQSVILQCTTEYPCKDEDLNLRVIERLGMNWNKVGLSDHSDGLLAPSLAVLKGATFIEKHFTLDKSLKGPDHAASLEPKDFCEMIRMISSACNMAGNDTKQISKAEESNITHMRRSVYATKDITEGEPLKLGVNCQKKRPYLGKGYVISLDEGAKARIEISKDQAIKEVDLIAN